MSKKRVGLVLILFLVVLLIGCGRKEETKMKTDAKSAQKAALKGAPAIKDFENIQAVKKQIAKLASVEITYESAGLSENEKKAVELMVNAAKYMDAIFLRQVYIKNNAIKKELKQKKTPEYQVLRKYFNINAGPFDRLNDDKPFINLKEQKPLGANFYPGDMTKQEFEAFIKANPDKEKAFTSNLTIIQRKKGKLQAVPYSIAYKLPLDASAKYLRAAAQLVDNASLKKYLNSVADAFASNDYFKSDMDWMDLKDHKIEVVFGPYEVYEDRLFGYKSAFEAFITIVDQAESKKLAVIGKYLDQVENNFPLDPKYKNFKRGSSSPIFVVNEVFTAGDTKAGTQTIAFNLPNDERVREAKGSKKVMLKNIARAKFDKCWTPIAKKVLVPSLLPLTSFDAFFNHILMHEVSHGLGPGNIKKNGKDTSVSKELKELYPTIEEAKADVLGLWSLKFLVEKGVLPKALQKAIYPTYLGGIFRSVRFGTSSAHGGSNAIQLNYILEKSGFLVDPQTALYAVHPNTKKMDDAVKQLAREILEIEATGDYDRAKKFMNKYCLVTPQLQQALDKLKNVPVDIRPVYAIEKILKQKTTPQTPKNKKTK